MNAGLLLMLLATAPPLTAGDKLPAGDIRDPQAFARIRSYCMDTRGLSDFDRRIVKDFLNAESKPKHLLTKLPWRLVPECQEAGHDAAAKVEFVPIKVVRAVVPQGAADEVPDNPYAVKVVLEVVAAGSQELVYSVEARAVINAVGPADASAGSATGETINPVLEKRDALYHAFWDLINDVRQVRSPPAK
ncbi:MAG TPA: hypothetical protein VFD30_19195 [Terriglobia bacterium]|nr:hypothetical protein [Terriglobia bacterium]